MNNKKPTIKTIAELAGVSHVAVSRALRGCSDISKATTEKILAIADEIGYMPNANARSLSSSQANSIGMIVPALGHETAYNDIFNAISASAAQKGLSVLLGSCGRDIELEKLFCRNMCENRVGALIISPVSSDIDHIQSICKNTVPLIFIGGKVDSPKAHCITMDYYHSGQLAVNHLYDLGHRDIALFVYEPHNKTIAQKIDGYTDAMQAKNLTPQIYWSGTSTDTLSAGKALIEELVHKNKLPTAIWCASDLMAIGVIEALRQNKIAVPQEVSVMGHDNLYMSRLDSFLLTTFSLPKASVGLQAVSLATSIMNRPDLTDYQNYVFKPELIVRESTAALKP